MKRIGLLFAGLLCASTVQFPVSAETEKSVIRDNITIDGVSVGGKTEAEGYRDIFRQMTEKFGFKYEFLTKEQQEAVREVYPQKISEAEPKKYGKAI